MALKLFLKKQESISIYLPTSKFYVYVENKIFTLFYSNLFYVYDDWYYCTINKSKSTVNVFIYIYKK